MDLSSLSTGEKIAAVSGAALFLLLFPSWLADKSAWELFSVVSFLLAILAITAVAFPVAKAFGYPQQLRPSDRSILLRVGTVALVLILAYFLEALGNAQVGLWLSVLAAAGIFYGAVTMPSEDAPRRRSRDRPRRPLADEDYEEPPPGMESWRESPRDEEEPDAGEPPAASRPADEHETDPGPGSAQPPRRADRRPARDSSFDDLEFEEPARSETRRSRRPPDVPPSSGR